MIENLAVQVIGIIVATLLSTIVATRVLASQVTDIKVRVGNLETAVGEMSKMMFEKFDTLSRALGAVEGEMRARRSSQHD